LTSSHRVIRVALCSPIASCRLSRRVASRRVASSPLMRLFVSRAVVVASSPPRLTCLFVAVSRVTSLPRRHRPSPHCFWLVVVFVPSLTHRCLRCVALSPLTRRVVAASPHRSVVASHRARPSHRCRLSRRVVSHHRLAVAISCVASLCLPSHVSSSVVPSSSRRIIAALPHLSFPVVVVALVRVRYPLR
jgi:hypothetical protein